MMNKKASKKSSKHGYRTYFNAVSVIILFGLLYIISDLIDFFPWGSSNRDGLILLIIPFFCLPVFITMLITDAVKMKLYSFTSLARSPYFWIVAVLSLLCIILPNMIENKISTILLFFSILTLFIYITFTMILFKD